MTTANLLGLGLGVTIVTLWLLRGYLFLAAAWLMGQVAKLILKLKGY